MVWICLGSNEEPRSHFIEKGILLLSRVMSIRKVSPVFESEPWGGGEYPFLNVVVAGETELSPFELLRYAKRIELEAGRELYPTFTSRFFKTSRPLDIDIIFWEDLVIKTPELEIPHPQAHERKFVLLPIVEMGEDPVHPLFGLRVSELLEGLEDDSFIRRAVELDDMLAKLMRILGLER